MHTKQPTTFVTRTLRLLLLVFVGSAGSVSAAEPIYPLWDGHESVADYAIKVNLPPTQTLDLGGDVTMYLALIPAGRFTMGTPEPTPVDVDGFSKRILTGQALLAVSGGLLMIMLFSLFIHAIRKRQRPRYSLLLLLAMTVAAGGCLLSGLHWRQSALALDAATTEYVSARARYEAAPAREKPARQVTLTRPFYIGKYLVTQKQYQHLAAVNPSKFFKAFKVSSDHPVDNVSWFDVQDYCRKLGQQTKQSVRLPTEAEWEFACRAGTKTNYYSGDTKNDLDRAGWHNDNSKNTTHPVGLKQPNAFGLFDMHGNLDQWCEDWLADNYAPSQTVDPHGPMTGKIRVMRGGSWGHYAEDCASASRNYASPEEHTGNEGFRVVVALVVEAESRTP